MIMPIAIRTRLSIPPIFLADPAVPPVAAAAAVPAVTGFPHLGQNSLPASSWFPQCVQKSDSGDNCVRLQVNVNHI